MDTRAEIGGQGTPVDKQASPAGSNLVDRSVRL